MSKICSKCKRELPETEFVKSDKYSDGLANPCKSCRLSYRNERLLKLPFCIDCKTENRMVGNFYCYTCADARRRTKPKKFIRRKNRTDGLCPECGVAPKPKGRGHCVKCNNKRHYAKLKAKGGQWNLLNEFQRKKTKARRLAYNWLQTGKIIKLSCRICDNPDSEMHHLDYDKPTEIMWLCGNCHRAVERWEKYKLTKKESKA
jgi:hypothetical protein